MFHTNLTSQAIDDVLAGTFPASDPPSWTPGMARPAPRLDTRAAYAGVGHAEMTGVRAPDVLDVSRPTGSGRTLLQTLVSLLGVAGIALLFPLAILAVGTPVALAVRGLLEVALWLGAMIR